MEWDSVSLSLQLAFISTIFLLSLALPLAFWFAMRRSYLTSILEALCFLPLLLPPTVVGFYLLLLMSPQSYVGRIWAAVFGQNLVFNFSGLVVGSVLCSLPLVLKPIQNAFERVDKKYVEMATSFGHNQFSIFCKIYWPLSVPAILSAAILGFAHTLSEFGVVLMLGGNIPGKTRTISIAIYDAVESSNYAEAHKLSILMLGFSFFVLCLIYREYVGGHKT